MKQTPSSFKSSVYTETTGSFEKHETVNPCRTSDEKLMVRFQRGDMQAFDELFHRHQGGVYRFVLRTIGQTETSADLAQDVFLRVVVAAKSFEKRSRFTTWLYTIARNLCIDHFRKMKHRRTQSLDQPIRDGSDSNLTLFDKTPGQDIPTDEKAHGIRLREHLARAIAALNPEQREVFLLREEAGLPFEEIAFIVKAPINTVKSRMRYALQNLQNHLKEQGVEA